MGVRARFRSFGFRWLVASFAALALLSFLRPGYGALEVTIFGAPGSRWSVRLDTGSGLESAPALPLTLGSEGASEHLTIRGRPLRRLRIARVEAGPPRAERGAGSSEPAHLPSALLKGPAMRGSVLSLAMEPVGEGIFEIASFPVDQRIPTPPILRLAQLACAAGLGWGIARLSGPRRRARPGGRARLLALAPGAVLGFWLLGQWPGYFMPDMVEITRLTADYSGTDWWSYLYSVCVLAVLQVWDHPGALGLAHVALASLLGSGLAVAAIRLGAPRRTTLLCFALFVLSPVNAAMTLAYNRDWLFGWVSVVIAASVPLSILARGKGWNPSRNALLALSLALVAASRLRHEGAIYLVALPLALAWTGAWARERVAAFAGLLAGWAVLFYGLVPGWVGAEGVTPVYRATSMAPTLRYVLNQPDARWDRPRDEPVIHRILNPGWFKGDPGERVWMVPGRWAETDYAAFQSLFLRVVRDNPGRFLEHRLRTFGGMLGIGSGYYFNDELRSESTAQFRAVHGIEKSRRFPALTGIQDRIMGGLIEGDRGVLTWRFLVAGSALPLLLVLCLAFGWRIAPATAAGAALLLLRVPILFLAIPEPQFKYSYGFYLAPCFLIPLALAERARMRAARRREAAAESPAAGAPEAA